MIPKYILENAEVVKRTHLLTKVNIEKLCKDDLNKETNLCHVLEKKFIHSLAALSSFHFIKQSFTRDKLSESTVELIILTELTQVDFADSIAENEQLRCKEKQIELFESLMTSATKGVPMDRNIFEHNLLKNWVDFLNVLCLKIFNSLKNKSGYSYYVEIFSKRLKEYYTFIALDHVRLSKEKYSLHQELINDTFLYKYQDWKSVPNWVVSENLWLNFLGDSISFLNLVFVLSEFNEFTKKDFLISLIKLYRHVGLLNVFLDDMIDLSQDEMNGDVNLVQELLAGKYVQDRVNLVEKHNIKHENSVVAFFIGITNEIELDYLNTLKSLNTNEQKLFSSFYESIQLVPLFYNILGKKQNLNKEQKYFFEAISKLNAKQ